MQVQIISPTGHHSQRGVCAVPDRTVAPLGCGATLVSALRKCPCDKVSKFRNFTGACTRERNRTRKFSPARGRYARSSENSFLEAFGDRPDRACSSFLRGFCLCRSPNNTFHDPVRSFALARSSCASLDEANNQFCRNDLRVSNGAPLTTVFLANIDMAQATVLDQGPDLEQALQELWLRGRASWPEVAVEIEQFLALIGRRFAPGTSAAIRMLHADDLYLLCAYLSGAPGASTTFESEFFTRVARALKRSRATDDEIAEIQQILRERLLNDRRSTPARSHYAGTGSLGSWLCISAVRELWRMRQRSHREALDEHTLEQLPAHDEDQELAYLKALYRREFKEAFSEALDSLTPKERNVLRYNVLKGLNITEIGAIYRVHRATIARWIARARDQLKAETHAALTRKVELRGRDLESVLRLIESQLDVSLRRRLGEEPPPT